MKKEGNEIFSKETVLRLAKRAMRFAVCMTLSGMLLGCGKETKTPGNPPDATGTPGEDKLVSEDAPQGGEKIMAVGNGIYGLDCNRWLNEEDRTYTIYYYDINTGIKLPLCNKPECRHDGNAYCVATNRKYCVESLCTYSNRLFAAAIEETDTQYICKLLEYTLDGSETKEIVTFLTLEKTEDDMKLSLQPGYTDNLFIHRNKAFVPVSLTGQEGFEDTFRFGLFMIDLETKEYTSVFEDTMSTENRPATTFQASGDYVYYATVAGLTGKLKNRTYLFRYQITEKRLEKCTINPNFAASRNYAVIGDDTVVYLTATGRSLNLYQHSQGHNGIVVELKEYGENEEAGFVVNYPFLGKNIRWDGTYLYVTALGEAKYAELDEKGNVLLDKEGNGIFSKKWIIFVFDKDLKEVAKIEAPEKKGLNELFSTAVYENDGPFFADVCTLRYMGEDIFCYLSVPVEVEQVGTEYCVSQTAGLYLFQTKRSDFLAGTPKWEPLYVFSRDQGTKN